MSYRGLLLATSIYILRCVFFNDYNMYTYLPNQLTERPKMMKQLKLYQTGLWKKCVAILLHINSL